MNRSISKSAIAGCIAVIVAIAIPATSASAQVEQPSQVSIQGTGLVTKKSNDQTPTNEATKSGGLLVGYSYQFSRWFGAEANYGYTRNTQKYGAVSGPASLQADFHEVTASLVANIPTNNRMVRPYVLGGGGAVVFDPTDKIIITGAERQTLGAFVYGGGANFDLTNRLGLRLEYRGLVYKVPDFGLQSFDPDRFTHLAQPSIGFVVRF